MYFHSRFLNGIALIYAGIIKSFSNLQSIFLFLVRVIWGHQFFIAGSGKFSRIDAISFFFENLNIPFSTFHAYLVAGFETVGGLLLIFGLGSRLISIPLAIIMITAMATAHAQAFAGFKFIMDPSILVKEAPFPFLLATLLVLIFGPGKISLDAWLKKKLQIRKKSM